MLSHAFCKNFCTTTFLALSSENQRRFCVVCSHVHVLQKSAFGKQKIMRRQCNFFEIA